MLSVRSTRRSRPLHWARWRTCKLPSTRLSSSLACSPSIKAKPYPPSVPSTFCTWPVSFWATFLCWYVSIQVVCVCNHRHDDGLDRLMADWHVVGLLWAGSCPNEAWPCDWRQPRAFGSIQERGRQRCHHQYHLDCDRVRSIRHSLRPKSRTPQSHKLPWFVVASYPIRSSPLALFLLLHAFSISANVTHESHRGIHFSDHLLISIIYMLRRECWWELEWIVAVVAAWRWYGLQRVVERCQQSNVLLLDLNINRILESTSINHIRCDCCADWHFAWCRCRRRCGRRRSIDGIGSG